MTTDMKSQRRRDKGAKRWYRICRSTGERGIALVSVLGLIGVMSVLSLSMMTGGLSEVRAAERFENRMFAFHLADGAIDQTIVNLRANRAYTGVPTTTVSNGRATGTYRTTATQSTGNPNAYTISAFGTVGTTAASYGYQQRNLTAVVELGQQSSIPYSIFSRTSIQVSGNVVTDAYDSRNGAYDPATASAEGHMGTNTTQAGFVMLSGNVQIKGDAVVGPGANPLRVITSSGDSRVWGTKRAAPALTPLPPVSSCSNPVSLVVSGNDTVTLPGGTYCYSQIRVTGRGRLNVTGTATLMVQGRVEIAGNGVGTAGNLPTNLTIKTQGTASGIPGGGQVLISGIGNFYGSIYAPSSSVQVSGSGDIFGSLVGDDVQMSGNGKIHYDKALCSGGTSSSGNELKAWTEDSLESGSGTQTTEDTQTTH